MVISLNELSRYEMTSMAQQNILYQCCQMLSRESPKITRSGAQYLIRGDMRGFRNIVRSLLLSMSLVSYLLDRQLCLWRHEIDIDLCEKITVFKWWERKLPLLRLKLWHSWDWIELLKSSGLQSDRLDIFSCWSYMYSQSLIGWRVPSTMFLVQIYKFNKQF